MKARDEFSDSTGAGPIFRAIMDAARAHYADFEPLVSMGVQDKQQTRDSNGLRQVDVCPLSGQLRGPECPQGIQEMIPANITLPTCEWHHKWTIDRRNGLLAGPSCPASAVVEKLFETLPSEYATWAKSQGRALPLDEYSPNCPAPDAAREQTAESQLTITEPNNGARYVIDPERAAQLQQLSITVRAPEATREVALEVDGVVLGRASRPFEFQWALRVGEHRLVAVDGDGRRSAPVLVVVRGAGE